MTPRFIVFRVGESLSTSATIFPLVRKLRMRVCALRVCVARVLRMRIGQSCELYMRRRTDEDGQMQMYVTGVWQTKCKYGWIGKSY